jgi:drug/metabolite transporter (DMT)-like permease
MGQPIAWRAFWGGALGLSGICILFWHELHAFTATKGFIGLTMALVGAYLVSVGNVVGARNAKSGLPVTQANTYGMAYGGLLTLLIHFGGGGELTIDWSLGYLGPMLYLTVFGSVVAFGCYMLLIGRIGADFAAYVTLMMPVIALILSTFFEDYRWTTNAGLGVAIVLSGNLIILTPVETLTRAYRRIKRI